MGKKAKAKKIRREEKQQAQATEKIKKPLPKKAASKKNIQIYSWLLSFIMLTILLSLGYLLFQKAFQPQPIAKLLPEKNTIALLEINTDFQHNQLRKSFSLLAKHPKYSKENFIGKLEEITNLSYANQIEPWLGRQAGMAILNFPKENTVHTLYFFEYISRQSLEEILTSKSTAPDSNVFLIDGPRYISILEDYVVFTREETALRSFLSVHGKNKLYNSSRYRKIDDSLPRIKTAFLYVDFENVTDTVFQHFPLLGESGLSLEVLQPFLKFFNAEGTSLMALDDNFAIRSFLGLDDEFEKKPASLNKSTSYSGSLTKYISSDVLAFWGGQNVEAQLKRFVSILAGGNEGALLVLDNLLNNYTKKYFGPDALFYEDISPLLQNEFAFTLEKNDAGKVYKILFKLTDPENNKLKLQELANSFASIGAIFEPKVVERVLPDGTVGKEIIAVPEEIAKNEISYSDQMIYELQLGKEGKGIYYSIFNNVAVVSNSLESVKNTLDLNIASQASLKNSPIFTSQIQPLLQNSDEVAYIDASEFLPVLEPITSISFGHDYFDDGIATINYINIK